MLGAVLDHGIEELLMHVQVVFGAFTEAVEPGNGVELVVAHDDLRCPRIDHCLGRVERLQLL
jgi:hypothetical protein